jgi:SLOG cluster3 family
MVAGEYISLPSAESGEKQPSPVVVYQSEAFRGYLPEETLQMYRLNYASIVWTDAQDEERFLPEHAGKLQCMESLKHMRVRMITETKPVAMVCIGGMEGVEEEVSLFNEYCSGPVYVIASTGGAALRIANEGGARKVRIIDRELHETLSGLRKEGIASAMHPPEDLLLPPIAYALVMQTIVSEISGGHDQNRGPVMMAR